MSSHWYSGMAGNDYSSATRFLLKKNAVANGFQQHLCVLRVIEIYVTRNGRHCWSSGGVATTSQNVVSLVVIIVIAAAIVIFVIIVSVIIVAVVRHRLVRQNEAHHTEMFAMTELLGHRPILSPLSTAFLNAEITRRMLDYWTVNGPASNSTHTRKCL